jgi:hypothetical protein
MDTIAPADPLTDLPRAAYLHLLLTLRSAMPLAEDAADAPYLRDQAAIAQVSALCPANLAEAAVAAQFAAANADAMAALALVRTAAPGAPDAARHATQANRMMRLAHDALRLLTRMQTLRAKRDADPATAEPAAWAEHCSAGWMAAAAHAVGRSHATDHDLFTQPVEAPMSRTLHAAAAPAAPCATDAGPAADHGRTGTAAVQPATRDASAANAAPVVPRDSSHMWTRYPVVHSHETPARHTPPAAGHPTGTAANPNSPAAAMTTTRSDPQTTGYHPDQRCAETTSAPDLSAVAIDLSQHTEHNLDPSIHETTLGQFHPHPDTPTAGPRRLRLLVSDLAEPGANDVPARPSEIAAASGSDTVRRAPLSRGI